MKSVGPESTKNVSARLRKLQRALEALDPELSQAELARRTGINRAAWNNALTGDNRLSVNDAIKLWRIFQIDLKWVYLGDKSGLPYQIAKKIDELEGHQGLT